MKSVAKILALYFFLGSFFPNTDFSQIPKILNLCEHYNLHQKEKGADDLTFSFTHFLLDHYLLASINHQHPNGNSHQNLPLHQLGHSIDFAFIKLPFVRIPEIPSLSSEHTLFDRAISSEFIQSVFQPPVA